MNPNVNDMILFHDLFTGTYEIRIDPASAQQMISDYRESIERESAAEIATLKAQRDELLAALKRLGTSEAFTAYALGRKFDEEAVARMEYACAAIANAEKDKSGC